MDVPHVSRQEYQVSDVTDDGFVCLMDDAGEMREDLKLPDSDIGAEIKSKYETEDLMVSSSGLILSRWYLFIMIICIATKITSHSPAR